MSAGTACPEAVSIHGRATNQYWEGQGRFPGQVAFKLRPRRVTGFSSVESERADVPNGEKLVRKFGSMTLTSSGDCSVSVWLKRGFGDDM